MTVIAVRRFCCSSCRWDNVLLVGELEVNDSSKLCVDASVLRDNIVLACHSVNKLVR